MALLVSRSTFLQDLGVNPLTYHVGVDLHRPALVAAEWRVPSVVRSEKNGSLYQDSTTIWCVHIWVI